MKALSVRKAEVAGEVAGGPVTAAPWDHPFEGSSFEIPPRTIVVEHSIFCGKDMGLRFYVRPNEMPRLLPGGES